jgi:hypothetical protein
MGFGGAGWICVGKKAGTNPDHFSRGLTPRRKTHEWVLGTVKAGSKQDLGIIILRREPNPDFTKIRLFKP